MPVDAMWTMRKWSGALHRRVPVTITLRAAAATWATIDRGAPIDASTGDARPFPVPAVVCFPRGAWWNAIWLDGHEPDLHVDIAIPVAVGIDGIETIDLDLDVVRTAGRVEVHDLVEFEHNRPFYPLPVIERAEATATRVTELIEAGAFPFDGSHLRHLAGS